MKLLIIGATGNVGAALLRMAMSDGLDVTVLVRDREKLLSQLEGGHLPAPPSIQVGDVMDEACVSRACAGQDAVINAAGHVADGERFVQLIDAVTRGVEAGLGRNGRFWCFGGAAALDVPGTDVMTVDLPGVPENFRPHASNYARVQASALNWSMLCPGPLIPAADGQPHTGLRVSTDSWPVPRPGITRYLPRIATSPATP